MGQHMLRRDPNGHVVQAGQKIVDVLEVSISAAGWTAVTLGADQFCKAIYARTRDGNGWILAATDQGTPQYLTVDKEISIDIVGLKAETLFYAKGTTSTTLEVMLLD